MKLRNLFKGVTMLAATAAVAAQMRAAEAPEPDIPAQPDVQFTLIDAGAAAGVAGPSSRNHLQFGAAAKPVPAQAAFCDRLPEECARTSDVVAMVRLTDEVRARIATINANSNFIAAPMSDELHYGEVDRWTFPHDLIADCDDYVKLKEDQLAKAGIPRAAMMEVVVATPSGEGHVVLAVRTDKGDLILDNLTGGDLPKDGRDGLKWPSETGYKFFKAYALGTAEWSKVAVSDANKPSEAERQAGKERPKTKPPKIKRAASAEL